MLTFQLNFHFYYQFFIMYIIVIYEGLKNYTKSEQVSLVSVCAPYDQF